MDEPRHLYPAPTPRKPKGCSHDTREPCHRCFMAELRHLDRFGLWAPVPSFRAIPLLKRLRQQPA